MIDGMLWRATQILSVALACAAVASCVVRLSDVTESSDAGQYVPAKPSFNVDAGAKGDGATGSDAAAASDGIADSMPSDGDVHDGSGDAAIESGACATQPYCVGNDLVTPKEGRLFCSKTVQHCTFGCADADGGAFCAPLDPASCPAGTPFDKTQPCGINVGGLCFHTKAEACSCLGCPLTECTVTVLKLPKLTDAGTYWSMAFAHCAK